MDRIGLRGVPEHQGRATDEVGGERLALERALELQFGLGLGAGLALRRRYRAVERELALGVMVGKTPVGDLEMPDQRHLGSSLWPRPRGEAGRQRAFPEAPAQMPLFS